MMKYMLTANNKRELEAALKATNISVPKRSEGRTKSHTERFAITHLLSTLMKGNHLLFPLELMHQERPDFLLKLNSIHIGIEHTEAVPQNEAHKDVLRDKINGPKVYFISHHSPGEPKKPANELIREIQTDSGGDGWEGNSAENEWCEVMHFVITEKNRHLQQARL